MKGIANKKRVEEEFPETKDGCDCWICGGNKCECKHREFAHSDIKERNCLYIHCTCKKWKMVESKLIK